MSFTVYVLEDRNGEKYKGVTSDLKRRLQEHRSGKVTSTKKLIDPQIVYTEEYDTFKEARAREVYFKTAAGRRFLKKVIRS